jgi:hypothetical protein
MPDPGHYENLKRSNMEQETLEEAAENYEKIHGGSYSIGVGKAFKCGAKWQAERMYSEEEVIDLLQEMNDYPTIFEGRIDIKEWFEQFKKK